MVRYSDIIKKTGKIEQKGLFSRDRVKKEDLRLSDAEIFQENGEKVTTAKSLTDRANLEIIKHYEELKKKAIDTGEKVRNDQGISPSPILSEIHDIIGKDLIDDLYEYTMFSSDDSAHLAFHTICVLSGSLKVGNGVGYDTEMLLRLGLAAFLENVGMYKIPDSILKKKGKLDKKEIAIIKEHPEKGAEILGRMGERYEWLAEVAIQIHERSDGSGYPRGLRGKEISEMASIIGLMDTYMAMISERPHRDKIVPTDAIKSIITTHKDLFPANILKTFLDQISLFPVNTYVRLNNRSIGVVLSTEKNQPLRPIVELVYNGEENRLERGEIIRLADNPLLYLVESVDEKKLPSS
jgi:HD-GYP domain-containing protein (c-di-GMP phosphodiesterase class II)